MEGMVAKLADKLKKNPDDANGWVMLARSYKILGRFADAAEAYSHAGALVDKEAVLLADYAEMIAQSNNGNLGGKAGELIERALKLDPDEPQALLLAGAAASDRQDFATAAEHWSRLLAQVEPGTEEAKALETAVARARELAEKPGKPGKSAKSAPANESASISGKVTLSPKLSAQIKPDDVLFVFARAEDGSRMPLAVIRATAGKLPLDFQLDDSTALPGGNKLSSAKSVTVEARIAKAGQAKTSSGDLFGSIKSIQPGRHDINLVIDQVQP